MPQPTPEPGQGIRLRRLVITNYKKLGRLEVDFPGPKMEGDLDIFVLGSRNGAGKSSVLECAALASLVGVLPDIAFAHVGESGTLPDLAGFLIKAGESVATVEGKFETSGEVVDLSLRITPDGFRDPRLSIPHEELKRLGWGEPAANRRPRAIEDALERILALSIEPLVLPRLMHFNSYRRVQPSDPELGELAGSSRATKLLAQLGPGAGSTGSVSAFKLEVVRLLMGSASLFEGLDKQQPTRALSMLNGLIERYCGGRIEKLKPLPDNRVAIRIEPRGGGESFSFDALSSGQKEMIATLFLIWKHTTNAPGIVLIDEPELHLNAEWHADFVEQLRRLAPRNQYILATHSPDVFASVDESHRAILLPDEDQRP